MADEAVHADVGAVEVGSVGVENGPWAVVSEDIANGGDGLIPVYGVGLASEEIDTIQPYGCGDVKLEADILTAAGELFEASDFALQVTAEGDGDIDDAPTAFSKEAERPAADDDLIIWVGREDEGSTSLCYGNTLRPYFSGGSGAIILSKGDVFSFLIEPGETGNVFTQVVHGGI